MNDKELDLMAMKWLRRILRVGMAAMMLGMFLEWIRPVGYDPVIHNITLVGLLIFGLLYNFIFERLDQPSN